jgi:hypothetical protein
MVGGPAPLMQALHFNAYDLRRNRQGQLTVGQRLRVLRELLVPLTIVVALGAVVVYFLVHLDVAFHDPILNDDAPAWPFLFSCLPIYVVVAAISCLRLWRSLTRGRVLVVEGEAETWIERDSEESETHVVQIGGHRFTVSARAYTLLTPQTRYRAHYVAYSEVILSIERVVQQWVDPAE